MSLGVQWIIKLKKIHQTPSKRSKHSLSLLRTSQVLLIKKAPSKIELWVRFRLHASYIIYDCWWRFVGVCSHAKTCCWNENWSVMWTGDRRILSCCRQEDGHKKFTNGKKTEACRRPPYLIYYYTGSGRKSWHNVKRRPTFMTNNKHKIRHG